LEYKKKMVAVTFELLVIRMKMKKKAEMFILKFHFKIKLIS